MASVTRREGEDFQLLMAKARKLLSKSKGLVPRAVARQILKITSIRPLRVVCHILEHGQVSTEELTQLNGYNQPPRGAQDVKEYGIPLVTRTGKTSDGRRMAIYVLGSPEDVEAHKTGRRAFPKATKELLVTELGERCCLCSAHLPGRMLQIDHRIPYRVAQEELPPERQNAKTLMLLCNSCNRAKSWECERCDNYQEKDPGRCGTCYWSGCGDYTHVAMRPIRRLDVVWQGDDVQVHDRLREMAGEAGVDVGRLARDILKSAVGKRRDRN